MKSKRHDEVIRRSFPILPSQSLVAPTEILLNNLIQRGSCAATLLYVDSDEDIVEIDQQDRSDVSTLLTNDIPKERMHICKLKVSSDHNILCVCWHGPDKRGSESENLEKQLLTRLLGVLHSLTDGTGTDSPLPLKERLACQSFIVAGDFSLWYSTAKSVIEEAQKGEVIIGADGEDGERSPIYMIVSPGNQFRVVAKVAKKYPEFKYPVVYITLTCDEEASQNPGQVSL